jgi:iron complex outermembrane receptor protein
VDEYYISDDRSVRLSAKGSFQLDGLRSDLGWNALQIYYPEMKKYNSRFTGNVSGRYSFKRNALESSISMGYGSRAPSVSESYGFYLFNTFDAYYSTYADWLNIPCKGRNVFVNLEIKS